MYHDQPWFPKNNAEIPTFPTFSLSFLTIFLLLIFHFTITIPPTFPSLLYYITLIIPPSFLLLFILTLLFPISFVIKIWYSPFHPIFILPIQKGEYSLSLSLSLSLYIYIYMYIIYSFLQFYFRLMIFCTFCISTLNWYILVICFFCSLSHVLSPPLIILIWVNSYILWKWKFEFI